MWILVVLNLLDATSTHLALKIGIASEVNPLLSWAFERSPDLFWGIKFALLSLSLVLLSVMRDVRSAQQVLQITNWVYVVVLFIHLHGWYLYFGSL